MLNVAIIGTGAISDSHIEGYLAFPDRCRIAALVDVDLDKAQKKIEKHGLDAAAIADSAQLKTMNVDLVSICLPPSLHCKVAVDLLAAGLHVLCEKPLAPSLDECDQMVQAARRNGKILSTVAQNRFKPDVQKVKRLWDSGLMGKPLSAITTSLWWRGENYYNLKWRGRWATEGGGCTLIHGIHHIDLMLWMMGEAQTVQAVVNNLAHTNSEVEDISMAQVLFQNGAQGTFVSSLLHHGEEQRLLLDAQDASAELPLKVAANRQLENGFPEDNTELLDKIQNFLDGVETHHTGHTAQILDVLNAIEQGTEPTVTGEDGRRAIEFILAVYQSAFTGQPVTLPMQASDPFYTAAGVAAGATKFYEATGNLERFANETIQVGGTL